jgi:DNA-binding NarL/FixJ family response regulator
MTANDRSEGCWSAAPEYENRRLTVIIADGTLRYLETVRNVLEFHEVVDLLGRAANFEETIQLVVNLRPELVLMDIEMPSAMVAIAAIVSTGFDVQIVGMFDACIPLHAPGLILSVSAFIDKARLCNDLLPALHGLIRGRAASRRLSHFHADTERQGAELTFN